MKAANDNLSYMKLYTPNGVASGWFNDLTYEDET